MSITHIKKDGRPGMVDVGEKPVTHRTAHAQAVVVFPPEALAALKQSGFETKKGPVFNTAIVAGVMAAKKTSELIPFCHPLNLDDCDIVIEAAGDQVTVDCRVSIADRTGVEMEALTGASVAALTIYDMCKSLSHKITIRDVRLMEKTGGQRGDYVAGD